MAREVFIRGQRVRLDSADLLGEGGEAEIYQLAGQAAGQSTGLQPEVVKLWKGPQHPDYAGDDAEKERARLGARARIRDYGTKLREFPQGLPSRVVGPVEPALSGVRSVAGFTMPLIANAQALRMYAQKPFRQQSGIDTAQMVRIFLDLYRSVDELHRRGIVIGDFNPMNVLVRGLEAFLIDADSYQFGRWLCRSFTTRYVDPLICDPREKIPLQAGQHTSDTDWYAFALMLFEGIMFVGPYGGVYRPKDTRLLVPEDARPLKRISVYNADVIYPAKAAPLATLPSRVAGYYQDLLTHDRRGRPDPEILDILLANAEGRYVDPAKITAQVRKREVIRGKVRTTRIFEGAPCTIVDAAVHNGRPVWLYHKAGEFMREFGAVVRMAQSTNLTSKIAGSRSVFAMGDTLAVVAPNAAPERYAVDRFQGRSAMFDTNARHIYWVGNGILYRDDTLGPKRIGQVLARQTRLWTGNTFGFGFYRAQGLTTAFVFDAEKTGINDSVQIPRLRGELLDAACYFSSHRAWFFTTSREENKLVNRCVTIAADGSVSAEQEADEGAASWLGSIYGKCATTAHASDGSVRHRLYAVTDTGLVGIDEIGGSLVETVRYPDTRGLLDEEATLLAGGANTFFQVTDDQVWEVVLS